MPVRLQLKICGLFSPGIAMLICLIAAPVIEPHLWLYVASLVLGLSFLLEMFLLFQFHKGTGDRQDSIKDNFSLAFWIMVSFAFFGIVFNLIWLLWLILSKLLGFS